MSLEERTRKALDIDFWQRGRCIAPKHAYFLNLQLPDFELQARWEEVRQAYENAMRGEKE